MDGSLGRDAELGTCYPLMTVRLRLQDLELTASVSV